VGEEVVSRSNRQTSCQSGNSAEEFHPTRIKNTEFQFQKMTSFAQRVML
jgi:hypothetical protein